MFLMVGQSLSKFLAQRMGFTGADASGLSDTDSASPPVSLR
jgi:hypothetical protein